MAQVQGGHRLKAMLKKAQASKPTQIHVGFFKSARYDDDKSTPVAQVASWNEFGTSKAPSRPFFRNAVKTFKPKLPQILKAHVNAKNPTLDRQTADMIGVLFTGDIQEEITKLSSPPNAPLTIALKRKKLGGKHTANKQFAGIETPLIDTGLMRQSVTHKVVT